jgi:hypothetical protein
MSRPPNDSKQRRPTPTAKRTRRANTPRRTISPTSSGNVIISPVADTLQTQVGAAAFLPEVQQAGDITLSLTPL